MQQPPNAGQLAAAGFRIPRCVLSWAACCAIVLLAACSNDDALIKTTAGYPPVELKPSDLPTFAVGDSFTFDNPTETWTVTAVQDGLVTWRSSLGGTRKTVFEPFMPPVEWAAADHTAGEEQLVAWGSGMFPLKAGLKTEFRTRAHRRGDAAATPYEWKCYSGHPRKVTVEAGAYPAYPVFCRRSDGLTVQSFYAPEVNASLMTTRRKRPDAARKRELVAFKLAKGPRIAATAMQGLPKGVALAAVAPSARPPQPAVTAVADARAAAPVTPPPATPPPATPPQIAQAPAPRAAAPATVPPTIAPRPAPQPAIAAPAAPSQPAVPPKAAAAPAPRAVAASRKPAAPTPTPAGSAAPTIAPPPLIAPPAAAAPPAVALAPAATPKPKTGHPPAAGGFGVQIASYRDADNVERGWVALRQRHTPLLNGLGHVVVPVDLGSGKGVYHRLIAGPFPARAAAEQLCQSIRGRGAACLVQRIGH